MNRPIILMKKSVAIILLLAYLAIGGLGFLSMLGMSHHEHTHDCPFMPGEKTACVMNVFDHVSAWRDMFTSILPIFFILAILLVVGYQASISIKELSPPLQVSAFPQIRRLRISVERSEYQFAFSQGILHPRNP